jgi:hypothetical protein
VTEVDHATVREWTDILARARIGTVEVAGKKITAASVKAVAGRLAAYADSDGTRVRPGLARVAVDLELSYDVVKRAVRYLAQLGLLRLVRSGAGARIGYADEYRLTIPVDLLERLDVWTPAQHRLEMERVRERARGRARRTPDPDPDPGGMQDAPNAGDTVTRIPVDNSRMQVTQSPALPSVDDANAGDTGTPIPANAGDTGTGMQVTQSPATYQGPSHKTDLPTDEHLRGKPPGSAPARADPENTQPAETTPSDPPALRLVEGLARNPLRRRNHVAEQIAAASARREAARRAHQATQEPA